MIGLLLFSSDFGILNVDNVYAYLKDTKNLSGRCLINCLPRSQMVGALRHHTINEGIFGALSDS